MRYTFTIAMLAVCLVACGSRGGGSQGGSQRDRQKESRKESRRSSTLAKATTEPVAIYGYRIVASYPHDPEAYTQGLFWHDGALYESTGEYGRSTLRRVELETGNVERSISLDEGYFAEGAVLLNDKIFQLTWTEEQCFVYDASTFERTGEFTYRGEGWGLATDGEKLYMSDGTPNITVRDPATFAAERTFAARRDGRPVQFINELEWIDGRLWANVYLTEEILIIDPADGRVEGVVDFRGITSQIDITPTTDVMNGIAHDPATGRIFVTGKNWNRLFEVEIFKK